jgi:cell surface protein SprA
LTFLVACLIAGVEASGEAGLLTKAPVVGSFHPLDEGAVEPSILRLPHPAFMSLKTSLIEERQVIDFEQRAVSFERTDKAFGIAIWQYRYGELDAYIENRKKFAFAGLWSTSSLSLLKSSVEKKKDFNILQMELPVQYPTWARRILGKEPPKLSITGFEEIIVSYEHSKTDEAGSFDRRGSGGIAFDQVNEFTVVGSVGRLINVNIKATTQKGVDASDVNDPLKNFKLEYKGEGNELEDEVIQEVSAGAMGFSMPGTSLSGYSESHKGLIGIQVKSKIGPLELTTIVSQEHGESQKASFDLSSGGGVSSTPITEKTFLRNKMFFLDTLYRNYFLNNHEQVPDKKKVDRATLQVWLHTNQTENEMKRNERKEKFCYLGNKNGTIFKLLSEGRDYKLSDIYEGCIRFDSVSVFEDDIIGICMATKDSATITKGDRSKRFLQDTTSYKDSLWILKGQNPVETDSNFTLMWRNVYSMPSDFDVSKFKISVKRIPDQGDTTDRDKGGTHFLSSILGLTDNNGNANIGSTAIYDIENRLLVIPPFSENGILNNKPFENPELGNENTNPGIYRLTAENFEQLPRKYDIVMSGTTKKTSFQLGMGNIMENTEKITANDGEVLKINEDYTIDYQFGTLQLTSKRALSKTRIDVEFQSESFFVPKSKVFLGMRGEMKLPFGQNSFLGASILYQDAASQERIPKIGQEPYSKLLLDANTKMDFEPKWMTSLVNLAPFISADDKSTASLEFEIANSRTNANTDGQAFIDNFESSDRPYAFGLDEFSWFQAAPPATIPRDSLPSRPPAWQSYWYQPKNGDLKAWDAKLTKDSIFFHIPVRRTQLTEDKYEPTLNFECQPAPNYKYDIMQRYLEANPWAGIMCPIPSASMNRTKDKYLEFYAKSSGGGRLYIDLGEVSEDICFLGGPPDGQKHDEDTASTGSIAFDANLDVGVDGKASKDEFYRVPNISLTGWDTLLFGSDSLGQFKSDPGRDNYQPYQLWSAHTEYIKNYPYANGKEGNANEHGYDSKDLLGDGLSTSENFFRRSIDFDSASVPEYLERNAKNYMVLPDSTVGNTKNGWHLYRIPLNDTVIGINNFKKIGNPRWDRIKFIRLVWTDFKQPQKAKLNRLQFARIQFVRNEWQETPIRLDSSNSIIKLSASTINTEDNPEYFNDQCPGALRITDENGNLAKESSLKLSFDNLQPGDTALVRNVLVNQTINLSAYTAMTMWVHGDRNLGNTNDLQYFFRFGNDDSTYYEYRSRIYTTPQTGWDSKNVMNINLHELSLWKQEVMAKQGSAELKTDKTQLMRSPDGKEYWYSVKCLKSRPPNFAGITWMAIGVTREGVKNSTVQGYAGDLWIDELKVSGVHDFNGWASRLTFNSNWAGFMNLGGRVDYTGADFQQMTNTDMKLGNSTLSGNMQASLVLGKLMPSQWGINIPIGASLSSSITRPTLITNSDVYLTNGQDKADGFSDMYADAINLLAGREIISPKETEASHFQSATISRSYYTGFDKTYTSKNPLVNLLLERLSLDYKYSQDLTRTAKGRRPENDDKDYVDSLSRDQHNGAIKYSLSPKPAPEWTKWKPFSGAKSLWIPERFKAYELSLLPSTLEFNVADITYSKTTDVKDRPTELGGLSKISTQSLTLLHGVTANWDPVSILKLNYSLNINRNLDNEVNNPDYLGMNYQDRWKKLLSSGIAHLDPQWHKYYILSGERDRSQTATLNFDPTLWDWLTLTGDYSSAYKQSSATLQNDPKEYKNLGVNTALHLSSTVTPGSLFKKLSEGLANLKAIAATFSSINKGFEKIGLSNITLSYSSTMSLINNYVDEPFLDLTGVSRLDFFKYQLGLKGRNAWDVIMGDMRDDVLGGMHWRTGHKSSDALQSNDKEDRRTTDRSYSARTSISLPEPFPFSINTISIKYSKSFVVQPDSLYQDTTITFPEFDISASTPILNKVKLVTNYFQGMTMSSSYNYQKREQKTFKPMMNDTITGVSHRFAPLIGLDGKLKKWPINISYSHTYNNKSDMSRKNGTSSELEHTNEMSLQYEIQKTGNVSEIRVLFWTLPLKGTFTVGMKAEQGSKEKTQESGTGDSHSSTTQNSSHYSLSPTASYTFTDNIVGGLSFSTSQTKEQSITTSSYKFSLSVKITLK